MLIGALLLFSAMLDSGMGEMHVTNFLTTLNIPHLHHKHLKERERESGQFIEALAQDSCADAVKEEKSM